MRDTVYCVNLHYYINLHYLRNLTKVTIGHKVCMVLMISHQLTLHPLWKVGENFIWILKWKWSNESQVLCEYENDRIGIETVIRLESIGNVVFPGIILHCVKLGLVNSEGFN